MGDRKLYLIAVGAPLTAALCLTACSPQDAKAPPADEKTAEAQTPTELQPQEPPRPTTPGPDQEPIPPGEDDEVIPASPPPPPPPPPPPLPTCPGDPRCEGKVIKR